MGRAMTGASAGAGVMIVALGVALTASLTAATAQATPARLPVRPTPLPVRRAPTPTAPPPVATPGVQPDAAKLAAELQALGTRALAEAAKQATPIDVAPEGKDAPALIPALGPCTRPSYDERIKLGEQLARRTPHQGELGLAFGCKDAAGVVVSVVFDQPAPHADLGVWRVVRVAASGTTTLAEDKGPARSSWQEFVREVSLGAVVELDFDGDGLGDVVLARYDHEGGARHGNATLSIWLSKSRRRIALGSTGSLRDIVEVAARQPPVGHTLVLQLRQDTDGVAESMYRCVEPPGQLTICPAVDPARRFARAVELATWFAGGHAYAPGDVPVPDRGQLAELLLPLSGFGVTSADRSKLFALAAPPTPEQTIAHEVERVRGLELTRQYGELVARPDPRAGRLLGMLGDTACPSISAAEARAADAKLEAWIARHDQAEVAAGDRRWRRSGALTLLDACVAGKLAYYEAQWSYVDGARALLRRAVFRVDLRSGDRPDGDNPSLIARDAAIRDATACEGCEHAEPSLTAKLYRHGATPVAVVLIAGSDQDDAKLDDTKLDGPKWIVDADGAPVELPGQPGCGWYTLGERTADNVVRCEADELAYFHWDGSWKQVARYPRPTAHTAPPKLEPTATWLWQQDRKAAALSHLGAFDLAIWRKDAAYRAETLQALAVAGADPATLGRASTATGLVK